MPALIRCRRLALPVLILVLAAPLSCVAADVLVEAEDVLGPGATLNAAWVFREAADQAGAYAVVSATAQAGFPSAPGHFRFDFSGHPSGPCRLWVRLSRWIGNKDAVPTSAVAFSDSQGKQSSYVFPMGAATAEGSCFVAEPGGIFGPDGAWFWLPVFDTGELSGAYELVLTADPGLPGTGNYKGVFVDAFRFQPTTAAPLPALPGDGTLPGRWTGSFWLSTHAPRAGSLSLTVPAEPPPPVAAPLLARCLEPALDAAGRDCVTLWVQAQADLPAVQISLRDSAGQRLSADLCDLADDRPLRLGKWYYLVWPFQAQAQRLGLHLESARLAELACGPLRPGDRLPVAGLTLHEVQITTHAAACRKLSQRASKGYRPEAMAARRQGLALLDFPRRPVEAGKKVIAWASGGWGGMPAPRQVREQIAGLHDKGLDGIVVTVPARKDGTWVQFPDDFWSATPYAWEDFADSMADLKAVDWGPLTSSLMRLNVMPQSVDWFDDAGWRVLLAKTALCGRICREGGLAGIMLDTEQYDWAKGIFRYEARPLAASRTLAEYQAQARRRGQQFGEALVAAHRGLDLVTTYGPYSGEGSPLLAPFVEGIATVRGCTVYDGWESSYPYRTLRRFIEGWEAMDRGRGAVQPGFALWVDHGSYPFSVTDPESNYFSPLTFAHALHYALRLSGKYVWLYRESKVTWWAEGTPPAYWEAIRQARTALDPAYVPGVPASPAPPPPAP